MKTIVITGGTSGIGLATVDKLRAQGERVIVLSRHASGQDSYACDVANEEQVKAVFQDIKAKYGNIDVLINNAGYGIAGAVELLDNAEVKKMMDVNFFGVLYCSQQAIPMMNEGGKILNISSACGLFPLPYRSLYCASKSAVSMLSYSMAMELKGAHIGVCAVCPGEVKTNFSKTRVKMLSTNERYGDRIQNAVGSVDKKESKRMSPDIVAKVLVRLCNKKHVKPLVIISGKYKLTHFLMRFVPLKWFLYLNEKVTGGHK